MPLGERKQKGAALLGGTLRPREAPGGGRRWMSGRRHPFLCAFSVSAALQVEEAAQKLMQQGVKSVLVKLGADGSLLLPGGLRGEEKEARKGKGSGRAAHCLLLSFPMPQRSFRCPHDFLFAGPGQPAIRQNAIKAPSVVDTTGAGDCFTAAFTVALLEGRNSAQALRFASAAGSLCVRRKGAIPSMPSRAEVDALLAEE
jgi:ribokinase